MILKSKKTDHTSNSQKYPIAHPHGKSFVNTLQWRLNGRDGISNHQPHECLLNRLFRRRSKKTPKLCATGLCAGIHRWPVNSPHKWPVTQKMFPFDDVIMIWGILLYLHNQRVINMTLDYHLCCTPGSDCIPLHGSITLLFDNNLHLKHH